MRELPPLVSYCHLHFFRFSPIAARSALPPQCSPRPFYRRRQGLPLPVPLPITPTAGARTAPPLSTLDAPRAGDYSSCPMYPHVLPQEFTTFKTGARKVSFQMGSQRIGRKQWHCSLVGHSSLFPGWFVEMFSPAAPCRELVKPGLPLVLQGCGLASCVPPLAVSHPPVSAAAGGHRPLPQR